MKLRQTGARRTAAWALMAILAAPAAWGGYREGMDALGARDSIKARVEFEKEPDNPKAVYELARMARQGLGAPRDDVRATTLLRRAAELGHAEAKVDLAYALGNGTGVAKDSAEALKLLTALAETGHAEALVVLTKVLRYGWWDVPKDEARSTEMARRAMDAGDDEGRMFYALALVDGIGLPKDEAKGAELMRTGAERGHMESQVEWARMLTFGAGVAKDEVAGTAMYLKAAERDNRLAQYSVGVALLRGRGIARDERAAVRWIDASARQGWVWAQMQLADMFRNGQVVPRLRNEAFFWYSVAARSTNTTAAERASQVRAGMARDMTDLDIARVQARVDAFRPQPGFKPRSASLAPPSRTDRFELGGASLRVSLPKGYINGWQSVDFMFQAFPNDPDLRPWLLVMNSQEDTDRMKLGLPGGLRAVEISRHLPDDSIKVTPTLFSEVKAQFRSQVDSGVSGGRFRLESTVVDDEKSWAIVRSGIGENPRFDGVGLVLVKEKVLFVAFTGFNREQRGELIALVRSVLEDVISSNRTGFFN